MSTRARPPDPTCSLCSKPIQPGSFILRLARQDEPSDASPRACPVCDQPATVTDSRPRLNWVVVENCRCAGFFVWGPLWDDGRRPRLLAGDRMTLGRRIQSHRATQSEAWLTTRDGTVTGALVIREQQPDQSTSWALPSNA